METDTHLQAAIAGVEAVVVGAKPAPIVRAFFDEPTFTATYVVSDPATRTAAMTSPTRPHPLGVVEGQ